jgi:hypothetical protein
MTRATLIAFGLLAASSLSVRVARAEPPNPKALPVYVLSIETDDADDQADALTQALRSRTRQVSGWSLAETGQSFGTLQIALKCPSKPDAPCLQRIGDQLHADHFMWGTMAKKKPNQVVVDMHLWSRGKGDADTIESYTDNLKDASDETLRAIASRIFGKLTGGVASGTLVIHAGTGGGTVSVDGSRKGTLDGGVARIDLPGGAHTVTVDVPGFGSSTQQANVSLGAEQELSFQLSPETREHPTPSTPFPVRKVLTYGTLIAGGISLAVGATGGSVWIYDYTKNKDDRGKFPGGYDSTKPTTPWVADVCSATGVQVGPAGMSTPGSLPPDQRAAADDACKKSNDAVRASTVGIVFGSIGAALLGTGLYLMFTDHDAEPTTEKGGAAAAPKPRVDVLPIVGVRGGAVQVQVTF